MWLFKKKRFNTDEEIVCEYYVTGNKALVGDLFEKHVKTVFGVCLFYFKDKDAAKDIVMQIFEKLITELKKSEVKNFKAWLSFVVRNYCISELRKNKNKHFVSESYLDFEITSTSYLEEEKINSVNNDVLLDYMKECLPLLKENQKICIELFYLQNLSYQQINIKTALSLNEIKSYIQNGKRNLKLLIEQKQNSTKHAA